VENLARRLILLCFDCFVEALRKATEKMNEKNFYNVNPAFDK